MSVLNGSSYSRFTISDTPTGRGTDIDLPLANSMTESYEIDKIQQDVRGFSIATPVKTTAQNINGYIITFTFDFSEWVTADTLKNKIEVIISSAKAGKYIKLTPRVDLLSRSFEVIFNTDTFDLGIGTSGTTNRLPVFSFKTKNLEPDLKWSIVTPPPSGVSGYVAFTLTNIAIV